MPIINKCPLCGKSNCVEVVQFTIDNNQYTAYKCTTTNNILNSVRNNVEKTLDDFKEKFDQLVYFNQTPNN